MSFGYENFKIDEYMEYMCRIAYRCIINVVGLMNNGNDMRKLEWNVR